VERRQLLERDVPSEVALPGEMDDRGAPATDFAEYLVASDPP
jgi:hypothetical protein